MRGGGKKFKRKVPPPAAAAVSSVSALRFSEAQIQLSLLLSFLLDFFCAIRENYAFAASIYLSGFKRGSCLRLLRSIAIS